MAEGTLERKKRYRVIEPTFEVEGGTPLDGLEHVLNEYAEEGYRFHGFVYVREAKDGVVQKDTVPALIMELVDVEGDS